MPCAVADRRGYLDFGPGVVQLSFEEWMGVKGAVMEGGRGLGSQRLAGVASVGVLSAWSSTDGRGSPCGGGLIACNGETAVGLGMF